MFARNAFILFATLICYLQCVTSVSIDTSLEYPRTGDQVDDQKKDDVLYRYIKSALEDLKRQIIEENVNIRLDNLNNRLDILNNRLDRELNIHNTLDNGTDGRDIVSTRLETLENNVNNIFQKLESLSGKLIVIENATIRNEHNIESMANNMTNSVRSEQRDETTVTSNGANVDVASPWCDVSVPRSIEIKDNIWQNDQVPGKDELDTFMKIKTECSYKARSYPGGYESITSATFNGTRWRMQFAVRSHMYANIRLKWKNEQEYTFVIGDLNNKQTRVYDTRLNKNILELSTPCVLCADRYTWFYVQLERNTMTFGKPCQEPFLVYNISINSGDSVAMDHNAYSHNGMKVIYCPQ